MDVERWWNKPERAKKKAPEETFLSTTCSITYSTSNRLVLSWISRLSCGVAMKNWFNFSLLLAI